MRAFKDGQGYELRHQEPAPGVRADAGTSPEAELMIYDVVGPEPWGGVGAKKVLDDLKALGKAPVTVRINSPGGDVPDGLAIYEALCRYEGKVTVAVDGIAASIATVIAMAGDTVRMAPGSLMMIHRCESYAYGNTEEMQHVCAVLEKFDASIFGVYAQRTGRRAATFFQKVKDGGGEWWLNATEAVKEGLADEVARAPGKEEQTKAILSRDFRLVPQRLVDASTIWIERSPSKGGALEIAALCAPRVVRANSEDQEAAKVAASAKARRIRLAAAETAKLDS